MTLASGLRVVAGGVRRLLKDGEGIATDADTSAAKPPATDAKAAINRWIKDTGGDVQVDPRLTQD
jgi:hypothetical protein